MGIIGFPMVVEKIWGLNKTRKWIFIPAFDIFFATKNMMGGHYPSDRLPIQNLFQNYIIRGSLVMAEFLNPKINPPTLWMDHT